MQLSLSEQQTLYALLGLAAILIVGRAAAEVARRLRQPEVLGELLGGVILGPSVLGAIFPGAYNALYTTPAISYGFSLFSWVGATLVLLVAGMEVDIRILRTNVRASGLAAAFAIIPSIAAGALFGLFVLHRPLTNAVFLGLVLSVTGVSVIAKILIERESLRRTYAQVIIGAGVASEVVVWLLIAIVSALREGDAVTAGIRAALFAIAFFALMMTLGRRFTNWAMRRTADVTTIVNGELTLVLVLMFISAAITQALGLHALLGAFVFGTLLSQAPRATEQLKARIQTLVVSLFAPAFFVLAGMRVNVFQLGSPTYITLIVALFVLATAVKVGMGTLGARLGGLRPLEALLVGVGVDLKGGTDVIVAILGAELGLLTVRLYTVYAVVAILTVLCAPPIIDLLERKTPPSREELQRLNREEARRRAYMPRLERVLAPNLPTLLPASTAAIIAAIMRAKEREGEVFDVTQLNPQPEVAPRQAQRQAEQALRTAEERLEVVRENPVGELVRQPLPTQNANDAVERVLAAAEGYDLLAMGAWAPDRAATFTLGPLQDKLIDRATADILLVALPTGSEPLDLRKARDILVVISGAEYTLAAGDVAGYVAAGTGAQLTLFTSVRARLDSMFWRERSHRRQLRVGYQRLRELAFRLGRLDVKMRERVVVADDPGTAILAELKRKHYDLLVMGTVDRTADGRLDVSAPVEMALARGGMPTLLLITHE